MFRKFNKFILLLLGIIFLMPASVYASAVSSWSDYHFDSKSKPPEGTKLVSLYDAFAIDTGVGYFAFPLPKGSYKVLSYDSKKDLVYGRTVREVTWEEFGKTHIGTESAIKGYSATTDLSTILKNEPIVTAGTEFEFQYLVSPDPDSYVLFFKSDAKTVDDLLYVCKVSELIKYEEIEESTLKKSTNATSNLKFEKSEGNSGTFKLTFNLGNEYNGNKSVEAEAQGFHIPELNYFQYIENSNKSGVEVVLNNLENKTYSYYIESVNGFKYEGTFKVDFATVDTSFEDELAEEKAFDKIPDRKPKVKVTGFPKKKVLRGSSVTLTLNSDIASNFNFNGTSLNGDKKVKSAKFEVSENGNYSYSVNTGKQVLNGTVEIDFFDDMIPSEDAVNKKLDTTGTDSSSSGGDLKLAQTGIESNSGMYLLLIAGVGVLTAIIVIIVHKKGVKPDEKN